MTRAFAVRIAVWVALMVLLTATVAVTYTHTGPWRVVAGIVIAMTKTVLIGWVFMDLRKADGLTRAAGIVGVIFLTVLFLMLWASLKG